MKFPPWPPGWCSSCFQHSSQLSNSMEHPVYPILTAFSVAQTFKVIRYLCEPTYRPSISFIVSHFSPLYSLLHNQFYSSCKGTSFIIHVIIVPFVIPRNSIQSTSFISLILSVPQLCTVVWPSANIQQSTHTCHPVTMPPLSFPLPENHKSTPSYWQQPVFKCSSTPLTTYVNRLSPHPRKWRFQLSYSFYFILKYVMLGLRYTFSKMQMLVATYQSDSPRCHL